VLAHGVTLRRAEDDSLLDGDGSALIMHVKADDYHSQHSPRITPKHFIGIERSSVRLRRFGDGACVILSLSGKIRTCDSLCLIAANDVNRKKSPDRHLRALGLIRGLTWASIV
jgi:hypothetical protein